MTPRVDNYTYKQYIFLRTLVDLAYSCQKLCKLGYVTCLCIQTGGQHKLKNSSFQV